MSTWTALLFTIALGAVPASATDEYFRITVVDEQTGRGVPLVELRTVNSISYYTDSNGIVAFYEPGLMDRDVFFFVKSDGYEFPADGFGMAGRTLHVVAGGTAALKIKRLNIAERLYRITGGGIYRDSVLTGQPVPIRAPVLNGDVLGQDSIQNLVYQGRLYWFWGDTCWPKYPLGNFHMSGATSRLPTDGGLDPGVGVNLTYFVGPNGFAKEMAPNPAPGPVWIDAVVALPDDSGRPRMYAAYARVSQAMKALERGVLCFNDDEQVFEKVAEFDTVAPVYPAGHPFQHAEAGIDYLWFPNPFPLVRVQANTKAYLDINGYEAWTPLKDGSTLDAPTLDRDAAGHIRYAWRHNTPALNQSEQDKLIKAGTLKPAEAWIQLQDADTGKAVLGHNGSVYWNAYRQRWITIRCESFGTSMLGETWYAEADTPLGPWVYARKVVTHDRYSFYNPRQHPEFDQLDGRIIYFEGTYATTFSGRETPTPRYDYNQIMYRLDLADERLILPVPVYQIDETPHLTTRADLPASTEPHRIVFFALDRPVGNAVAVCRDRLARFLVRPAAERSSVAFYALPADAENPPATTVPLYEFTRDDNTPAVYTTDPAWSRPGYHRSASPLCRVWRNPLSAEFVWEVR